MLQYIFFIYNSTIKESNEVLNNENHCSLYQNQENIFLEREFTKIYNLQYFGQDDTRGKKRTRNNSHLPFHPHKKPKLMLNESESYKPLDLSNKATNLTQKLEEFFQSNTRVKTRARKMTCMSLHSCKKPKLMLNESESHIVLEVPNEIIDLTQESEENSLNDMLKNKNEKSLPENNTSTLQNSLEINFKHSDAEDKEETEKPSDPSIITDILNIIADEMFEFQNTILKNNKNGAFDYTNVMQNFKKLQKNYKTQNLKKKLSALNFFIEKEFVYDKQFILNFLEAYNNPIREKNYCNFRYNLNLWKKNTSAILSSKVPILQKLISKSSLKKDMKDYLKNYIEFIKISLKHIMKLIPDHRLKYKNIIKLLYWYMRFTNETNILDNLFDLVGLQKDLFETKITLLLKNENFKKFNNCLTIYLKDKELIINVCIKHTIYTFTN